MLGRGKGVLERREEVIRSVLDSFDLATARKVRSESGHGKDLIFRWRRGLPVNQGASRPVMRWYGSMKDCRIPLVPREPKERSWITRVLRITKQNKSMITHRMNTHERGGGLGMKTRTGSDNPAFPASAVNDCSVSSMGG